MGRSRVFATAIAAALAGLATAATAQAPLGHLTFPNSGSDAAQGPFIRGVLALHSFWYDEAAEAFREAQRADPGFALAYWGEAMTYNHPLWREQDRPAALTALGRLGDTPAERAGRAPTAREKGFLAAVEALYDRRGGDEAARDRAYAAAMDRLHRENPNDPEAALFDALALLGRAVHPGEDAHRLRMRAAAIAEEVFAANPHHPGAAHYLIHAYDDPIHAPLGLRAARVYAGIAPAAHHALHMPSHIFVQLGMWDEAVKSNRAAWEASVAWTDRRGLPVEKRDFHSLSWLHYALLQAGEVEEAASVLATARSLAASSGAERLRRAAALMAVRQGVETGRWDGVATPASSSTGYGAESAAVLYGAGAAAVARGELPTARRLAGFLDQLVADEAGEPPALAAARVAGRELHGLILQAAGDREGSLSALAEAAELEAELDLPSGPPNPVQPAGELYGEALLAAGRPAEAAAALERALGRTPGRRRAVAALARARGGR